jgi:hypothetical protein
LRDTVAIVGSHPQTRALMDFARDDCDIIVFNEAMKEPWCSRADYVFQMHIPTIWRNPKNRNDPNHYEWLQREDIPLVVMMDHYEDVPQSVKFPLDEICDQLLGSVNFRYFTSSVAYALAFAIYKGYKKIELYGVEMETQTEYASQRPGVAFWVGYAAGAGIEFESHVRMFTEPLYGYEGDVRFKYEIFDKRLEQIRPVLQRARDAHNAKHAEANRLISDYIVSGNGIDAVVKSVNEAIKLATDFGIADGARQEIERYKGKADAMLQASSDFLFSRQEFEGAIQAMSKGLNEAVISAQTHGVTCSKMLDTAKLAKDRVRRQNRMRELGTGLEQYTKAATKVGLLDGARKENVWLISELDALIRAAGGQKSVEVIMDDYNQKVMERELEPVAQ